MPARFDGTAIPGLRDTVHYIDLRRTTPQQLADLVQSKIGARQITNYFPPVPDKLFHRLGLVNLAERNKVAAKSHSFFFHLGRMTPEERNVLTTVFRFGCSIELPENIHINLDYLRRLTGMSPSRCLRILTGTRSLGVESKIRKSRRGDSEGDVVVVEWHDMRVSNEDPNSNATGIANEVIQTALEGYCDKCGPDQLARLDFSQLSRSTFGSDMHEATKAKRKVRETDTL